MPTPRTGETEDSFISRCIPEVIEDGTARGQEQAVAVCHSLWRNRNNTRLMAIAHQMRKGNG